MTGWADPRTTRCEAGGGPSNPGRFQAPLAVQVVQPGHSPQPRGLYEAAALWLSLLFSEKLAARTRRSDHPVCVISLRCRSEPEWHIWAGHPACIMNLLRQGAGGLWTGLGWVTPDWVDKLLLGHTVRQERSGWGRQVIIRTASAMRQPIDRVRPHPDRKGFRVWGKDSAGLLSSLSR